MSQYLDNAKFQAQIVSYQEVQTEIVKLTKKQESYRKKLGCQSKEYGRTNRQKLRQKTKAKVMSAGLWESFFILASHFCGYMQAAKFTLLDADDAIQEATITCMRGVLKYDPEKGKAFSYFTQVVYNKLLQMDALNMRYRDLMARNLQRFIDQSFSAGQLVEAVRSV